MPSLVPLPDDQPDEEDDDQDEEGGPDENHNRPSLHHDFILDNFMTPPSPITASAKLAQKCQDHTEQPLSAEADIGQPDR